MLAALPRSVSCALSAASLALACSGPSPQAVQATPAAEVVKSTTPEAASKAAPAAPATPQLSAARPSEDIADPSWFSPALFPNATVTKKGRSAADDQGRFTAQILFALPAGATLADCTDPLARAVASLVPKLDREEKEGRVTLKGDAADYHVIFVCGEVKGAMTAFVSYRWTRLPPATR